MNEYTIGVTLAFARAGILALQLRRDKIPFAMPTLYLLTEKKYGL